MICFSRLAFHFTQLNGECVFIDSLCTNHLLLLLGVCELLFFHQFISLPFFFFLEKRCALHLIKIKLCTTANYVNLLFPEAQPCVCIAINLIKSIIVCIKWLPNIRLNTFILIVYFQFYAKTSPSSLFIPIQNDFNQE